MKSLIAALVFCLFSSSTFAWDEKWPVEIKLSQSNFLSEFLRANFGKVGEIAAKRLDDILNDPAKQAKLAASTIKKLNDLYDKYQRDRAAGEQAARDAAAREFIALIEADIGTLVGPVGGTYNMQAAYSAKYGVMRLTWDRQINRSQCQRSVCTCPNGSSVPGPGYFCYTNTPYGQTSQPASCTFPIDYVDTEAEYKVYRNSKLIATFAGAKSVSAGSSYSIGGNIGPISLTLSTTVPPSALGPAGRAGPFYDFDPQNENFGTPLAYRVEARSVGCSEPYAAGKYYNNNYVGMISGTSTLTVDANGDARPDWYPEDRFVLARTTGADSVIVVPVTPPSEPSPAITYYNPADWNNITVYGDASAYQFKIMIAGNQPSGSVRYFANGVLAATAPVVNGVSEVNLAVLYSAARSENFNVFGVYSGDANNPAGTSPTAFVGLHKD